MARSDSPQLAVPAVGATPDGLIESTGQAERPSFERQMLYCYAQRESALASPAELGPQRHHDRGEEADGEQPEHVPVRGDHLTVIITR